MGEAASPLAAFLACRRIALAGASRGGRKFGDTLLRELAARGREVQIVHPAGGMVAGRPAVARLADLPKPVDGLVVCLPPGVVPGLLEEAAAAGIRRIWLQQGSSSLVAVARGRELDLELVAGECLLLHLEPVKGIHAIHRWLRSLWRRA
ncbi:MAG: CoA-binding protein [bacterium]|jgi:hypothetical protein|nr:CoA-binding protein [bacterium]